MDLRKTFNQDVENYDRWRPKYCPELFEKITRAAQLQEGKCALEIGSGTGQATEPILKTGCQVLAVELGEDLAAYTAEKFKRWQNFAVFQGEFEQYPSRENSMNLVFSATAFHWIAEEVGYPKVFQLLKPGGTIALFWNRPRANEPIDLLHVEIQKIYEEFRTIGKFKQARPEQKAESDRYAQNLLTLEKYGFVEAECFLFNATRQFTADEYPSLLETYSDHRSMPEPEKSHFYAKIKQTIAEHGGVMNIYDTMDLYLAKKPNNGKDFKMGTVPTLKKEELQ